LASTPEHIAVSLRSSHEDSVSGNALTCRARRGHHPVSGHWSRSTGALGSQPDDPRRPGQADP